VFTILVMNPDRRTRRVTLAIAGVLTVAVLYLCFR
jgi:hypothetical protein